MSEKSQLQILKNLNILYIEDEEKIRINVKKALELICNNIYESEDINSAKSIFEENRIDIIISDINLPDCSGLDYAKELRKVDKSIPIILLSAYTDKEYLLEAAKLKLVNYLTKPIDFNELKNSLLNAVEDIIDNSRYTINFPNNVIYNVLYKSLIDTTTEKELPLTAKEITLLEFLIKNNNRVVSHEELKLNIWQDSFEATDSALKNLLNKLRKKIGKDTIINISGIGYRLNI